MSTTKKPTNDAARVIGPKGIMKLEELWLNEFHAKRSLGSNAERWFGVVLDFLSIRGDEIVPNVLREQEERLINLGKSQEYLAALAEIVETSPHHNDYDKTVMVLTATPEERAEALKKVLGT